MKRMFISSSSQLPYMPDKLKKKLGYGYVSVLYFHTLQELGSIYKRNDIDKIFV